MQISVTLNPGHPTGTYRRAGHVFTRTAPTLIDVATLDEAQVEALQKDPWLTIEPVRGRRQEPKE